MVESGVPRQPVGLLRRVRAKMDEEQAEAPSVWELLRRRLGGQATELQHRLEAGGMRAGLPSGRTVNRQRVAAVRPGVVQPGALQSGTFPLPDLFASGQAVQEEHGTVHVIRRNLTLNPPVHVRTGAIDTNLQLLRGIGPWWEARLAAGGCNRMQDLASHARWGLQANQILGALQRKDVPFLLAAGVPELDLAGFFAPEEFLFVDIETTSLHPVMPLFLVGLFRWMQWPEGAINAELTQLLAPTLEDEQAILELLAREWEETPATVTYNGRTFDIPFLRARCAVHRVKRWREPFHLDLLKPARAHFRDRLPNCRLVSVERGVLGIDRGEDIPGEQIPQLYYEFCRTNNPEFIEPILIHNARDLISLALLFAELVREAQASA